MIKGEQRQQTETELTRWVGFTGVQLRAINPTRDELNKLLGREGKEDDKELVYASEDEEGNKRIRLNFWLYSEDRDKFFSHSFNLTNKEVVSKDKTKMQFINNTATTTWVDDEENLPVWFKNFTDKKTKANLGPKKWRKAILGEGELAVLLRSWLGRFNWSKPSADVLIDTKKLFNENYSELRELIDSDYDTPFVALTGVRTDAEDKEKQYQQVYGKGFLPANFYQYIMKGNKFPKGYAEDVWLKFEKEAIGEHGFKAYFELVPLCQYDKEKDPAQSDETNKKKQTEGVTAINPKF